MNWTAATVITQALAVVVLGLSVWIVAVGIRDAILNGVD